MKKIFYLFLVLIIFFNPLKNFVIQKYIETKLTNQLGFEVEINKFNYSIFDNSIIIENLFIINPLEFKYLYAITIEKIVINNFNFKKNSINSIFINETNFYWDQKNGKSNLTMLLDNIKKSNENIEENKKNEMFDNKDNSFLKNFLNFNLKKLLNKTIINFIKIDDSYFTLHYKFFKDQSISIPLEKYETEEKTINTLLGFFNKYIDNTVNKINDAERYSDLISIFPEWEKEINKIRKELIDRKEIEFQ